jgi:DNA-binding NarL/FixJ family response regulator
MTYTKIAIACPLFLVREGLKKVIEGEKKLRFVGEITNGIEFWVKIENYQPDIIIVDYNYLDFINMEDILKVLEFYPGMQTIIISDNIRRESVLYAIKNGINVFLTKDCEKEEIINSIEAVLRGEKYFCGKILDIILEKNQINNGSASANLSSREYDVIKLIVEGYSNKQIADKLFISIHTVYTHRKNIMKKLELKSPMELILYAINAGVLK